MLKRKLPIGTRQSIILLMLVFSSLLAVSACSPGNTTPSPPVQTTTPNPSAANTTSGTISFAKDVEVIFNTNCVVCNQGAGAGQSGLSLEPKVAYGNIVGVPSTENPQEMRVKARAPDQSYLIAKITETKSAFPARSPMPFTQVLM